MKKVREFGNRTIRVILFPFFFLFLRPKTFHKENIPKKGGIILAGNHLSVYDGLMIGYINRRPIHFLAKKELFDSKLTGPIMRFGGLISVDRKNKNPEAKEMALEVLRQEKAICVFPEGTLNRTDGDIIPFKFGAVSFAYKSGKPIVPFAIVNKAGFFKYHTKVVFGKPYYVKSDDLASENKKLEQKVIDLIHEGRSYGKRKA